MCDSCNELSINGINFHEIGCPDSWKNSIKNCKNCGTEFTPEESGQSTCSHTCYVNYWGISCDCEECWQGYPEQSEDEEEINVQENIEIEDESSLKSWLKEFNSLNSDKISLPHIPYNMYEIQRELNRREMLEDEDFGHDGQVD